MSWLRQKDGETLEISLTQDTSLSKPMTFDPKQLGTTAILILHLTKLVDKQPKSTLVALGCAKSHLGPKLQFTEGARDSEKVELIWMICEG